MEFNKEKNRTQTFQLTNINPYKKDDHGNTPLHIAASKGDLNQIRMLVKIVPNASDIIEKKNKYGSTPLHYATWFNQLKIIKYLVALDADLKTKDNYDQTLLHAAAWNGHLDLMKFFFDKGLSSSLEDKDQLGNTPLLSAAKNSHWNATKWLISKGANLQAKNNEGGDTLLSLAAKDANLDVINYLAHEKQMDLWAVKKEVDTLLHFAILYNSQLEERNRDIRPFVTGLLKHLAVNIDAKDNDGNTPLHIAAEYANLMIVKHLANLGANIETKNNDGNTPLDFANSEFESGSHTFKVAQNYLAIIEYLKRKKIEKVNNPRLSRIHRDKLEGLGNEVSVRDEDLFSSVNLLEASPNQTTKAKRSKKILYYDYKPQAMATITDPFAMQRLNDSLTSLNTGGFFTSSPQATQAELSPFNLSSISEEGLMVNNPGMSHLTVAASLFGGASSSKQGKNLSITVNENERLSQQTQIIEATEQPPPFPSNMTAQPF